MNKLPSEDQESPEVLEFVNSALKRLPSIPDERDQIAVSHALRCFYHAGWTLDDAVAYSSCLEEVDPSLDEDQAIAKMSVIRNKYNKD